jgi:NADH dehydrogenase FAD-containing subunit
MSDFRVVVCGGGIAAVEGLLRLRRLLGGSVDIEVVAPNDELVMRPLAVRQPFALGPRWAAGSPQALGIAHCPFLV